MKRADQKAAAASKLEKQGKPNPRRKAAGPRAILPAWTPNVSARIC
ncbi:hypothetical protein HDF11_003834 [Tunturiibacter psychrotolerans]